MATVIRSVRIEAERVIPGRQPDPLVEACPPASPQNSTAAVVLPQQPAAVSEQIPAPPREDRDESARIALREKERQLEERERKMREELANECRMAREAAYTDGYKQGEEDGAKAYRERLDALGKLIASLQEELAGDIFGMEDVIVDIAFESICKILGNAMCEREGILAVVREVSNRAKDREKLILRVSPQDYRLLAQHRDVFAEEGRGIGHELVADDRVVLGGCLIETAGGTLDGRLETQLQKLSETLISARRMLPE